MPISTSPFLVLLQGCVAAMWGVLLEGALCFAGRTFYFEEDVKMSRNSSGIIQVVAIVLGLITIVSFLFLFIFFMVEALTTESNVYNDLKLALILTGAIASALGWVASLALYGFGEMIASMKNIEANMTKYTSAKMAAQKPKNQN